MRGASPDPRDLIGEARVRLAWLAAEARDLGPATWLGAGRQRCLRLVLDFCDRLCLALQAAERRLQATDDLDAVRAAAATLHALERLIWRPLEPEGPVLFRWVQRRPDGPTWEVDYLGLEYHLDRRGSAFVLQLLALEAELGDPAPAELTA